MARSRFNTRQRLDSFYGLLFCLMVPVIAIRFALFAPFGDYSSYAKTHNTVIHEVFRLHNETYPVDWIVGEKIASKWGNIGFYWNVVIWAPSIYFIPPFNLPVLVMDAVITGYMSLATHYQTNYSPHDKNSCYHNPNFHDMARPAGVNESFFEITARLNATVASPQDMCASFVKEWQYGVAVTFFYALITFLQLIAFLGALACVKQSGQTWLGIIKGSWWLLLNGIKAVPLVLYFFLAGVLYYLPEFFFRCLPVGIKGPIRRTRRVAIKTGLGVEQHAELKMTEIVAEIKKKQAVKRRFQGGEGQNSPLAEFLGIYDMLLLVTPELHFVDVMSLSRVSKSIREVVLPLNDFDRRFGVFEMYTCPGDNKSRCWICSNQVCSDCHQLPQVSQTSILFHLDCCEPFCSSCYHEHVTKEGFVQVSNQRKKKPDCKCAPKNEHPNIFERVFLGAKKDRFSVLGKLPRSVCRECNKMNDIELLAARQKRTKHDLMQGRKSDGTLWTQCAVRGCGKDLGRGPRWWICNKRTCRRECRSLVHRAWGSKQDASAVNSDAV